MDHQPPNEPRRAHLSPRVALLLLGALIAPLGLDRAAAHIVPPESLHPVAESYRRLAFLLDLNPVPWGTVVADVERIGEELRAVDDPQAERYLIHWPAEARRAAATAPPPELRREVARALFADATRAVARIINARLGRARGRLADHAAARAEVESARQVWAAFEPAMRIADPDRYVELGECWLELTSALGHPGVLGYGRVAANERLFAAESEELVGYLATHFGDRFEVSSAGGLSPLPSAGRAGEHRPALARLPPGSEVNKQLPRPRQVLNMTTRGVDESETVLIALGDMAFDSPMLFGEPARSLGISCNTCHNKGVTNPQLFIPGLSSTAGGLDVSNSFFAPHANNGHFDPVDIPDLRGIRFTAPYGRNGRFGSLREFTRNVIVGEFNGAEPHPLVLDAMVAYMFEFDFLPNPLLGPGGRLTAEAPEAARRGEEIFHRPFAGFGGRSCASCHLPTDHFLDRRRHDVGSVAGAEESSLDRALDTPTLLSSRYTAPYFHDGSLPTLAAVTDWFDERFDLGLTPAERSDLTAYVETVGDGREAYEETRFTLAAELEEFSFFLSAYEFLRGRGERSLIELTMGTVAQEIRAHKWDLQQREHMPVLDRLIELVEEAAAATRDGDLALADERVAEYRRLYAENAEVLQ